MKISLFKTGDITFIIMAVLFLSTTMIVPSNYSVLRLGIVLIWFLFAISEGGYRLRLFGKTSNAFSFYIIVNMICLIVGVLNGSISGVMNCLRPYILWPIIFFFIVSRFNTKKRLNILTKLMLGIEFVLCAIDIWYCFGNMGILPSFPSELDFLAVDFRLNTKMTTIRFSTNHVNTHIFMIPFTIAITLEDYLKNKHDFKLYVLLLFEIASFYLSGRIALWLSTLASIGIMFFFCMLSKKEYDGAVVLLKKIALIGFAIGFIIFISTYFGTGVSNALQAVSDKLNNSFTENKSLDGTRYIQMQYLWEGWKTHPLFGNGMGSHPEYIRDNVNPWGYEMTYHYILYQGGIVQFVTIFYFFGTILWFLWKSYKENVLPFIYTIPHLAGLTAFIVATSVEPYMFKLGAMWIVFFPFGFATYGEKMMKLNMKENRVENSNIGGWIRHKNFGGEQIHS